MCTPTQAGHPREGEYLRAWEPAAMDKAKLVDGMLELAESWSGRPKTFEEYVQVRELVDRILG
jgi:hypothetical protein